ncbi:MAG: lipocalin family protein [Bacteroidaceae bacterium]|nr:lipocalin family protein [Bacteroidaceae bacterium]
MNKKNYLWSMFTMLMVAIMSAAFISCNKDDDDNKKNEGGKESGNESYEPVAEKSDLIGLWEITAIEGYTLDKETGDKETFSIKPKTDKWDEVDVADYVRIEFKSDNTGATYEYNDGNWVFDSNWKYTYDKDKKLISVESPDDEEMTVLSLTASTLVIETIEEDEDWKDYFKATYKKIK